MNRFLFLIVAFVFSTNISAQTNFVAGTVVTNDNDSLRGQIDFQGWDRNPTVISFRNGSIARNYTPIQIKAFIVSDIQYVSAILPVEQYSLQVRNMSTASSPGTKSDTVFLELISSGPAKLYYLNDRNTISHFFYQMEGGDVKELSNYHFVKITDDGKKIVSDPKRYLGTLNLLMKECIDIMKEKPSYKMAELKDLFRRYNQCKSPSSGSYVSSRQRKLLWEPGIILGASLTAFSLEPGGTGKEATSSPSVNPSFGLALNLVLPTSNRRWSVNNELTYRAFSPSTETAGSVNGFDAVTSYYFEVTAIKLTNAIRYEYASKNIKPFFNIGVFNSFALKNENKRVQVLYLNSEVRTNETSPAFTTRDHEIGFLAGAGLGYRKFLVEFRYERGNGLSNAVGYSTTINTFYFLLTYRFSKSQPPG